MVVLVDSNTASAAEIVTAALQDHQRATVVGTHTFGKGVFQEEEPLSNGGALDITVGEYFTPNGRNLGGGGVKQGAGITPEVKVAKGVDERHGLEVALETLRAKVEVSPRAAGEPLVAVLRRRGRFLSAEPLFGRTARRGRRARARPGRGRRGSSSAPARGSRGSAAARGGRFALVAPGQARRLGARCCAGSGARTWRAT